MSDTNKSSVDAPDKGAEKSVESTPQPCPVCETALDSGASFCPQCGRKLVQANAATESAIPAGESTGKKAPVPESKQNGSVQQAQGPDLSNVESAAPVKPEPSPQSCQCSCGQNLPAGAQFCYRCGGRVGQPASQYRILCTGKANCDTVVNITGQEFKIGKSADCEMVIGDDDYISRRHACLVQSNGSILLKDLDSSNGTFLRVQRPTVLEHGDEFLIGTRLLRLEKVQV